MNNLINRWPVWLGIAVVIWLIHALQSILMPFFAGALLAYLCNPLVNRLTQWKMKRVTAVTAVFSVLFLSISAVFILLIPVLWRQFMYLYSRLRIFFLLFNRQGITLL